MILSCHNYWLSLFSTAGLAFEEREKKWEQELLRLRQEHIKAEEELARVQAHISEQQDRTKAEDPLREKEPMPSSLLGSDAAHQECEAATNRDDQQGVSLHNELKAPTSDVAHWKLMCTVR